MALRRESWVVIVAAVALSVATVALSRQPARAPAQPAAPSTPIPGPFHAYQNMVPGIFYPIAYLQQNPRRWVGKTVQISSGLYQTGHMPGDMVISGPPPFDDPIPIVAPNTTTPFALLLDGGVVASVLPLAPGMPLPSMATHGSGTGGYYLVHLAWWPHCGALGFGKSACLVADRIHFLHD